MMLDVCLGTRSAWKILLFMSETPGKVLTRKQISEHTKMGNKALVKFLLLLEKFDVIQEVRQGRQFLYKMNVASPFTGNILELIQLERRQLNAPYFGHAIVLREFVYELTNLGLENTRKVVLFGSVAKHTAAVDSDIDIAIVQDKRDPKTELDVGAACSRIEKRFKCRMQVHYFTAKEFESKPRSKLVDEILRDGITLF